MDVKRRLSKIADEIRPHKPVIAEAIDKINKKLKDYEKIPLEDVPSNLIPEFLPKNEIDSVMKSESGNSYTFRLKKGYQGITLHKGRTIKNTMGFMGNDFAVVVVG